ncbi:TonB-dependent hemoglobin/transferrin/lactoferrin family receptor [Gilliamella sp. G0441]|uniref:TonB-dependent hemoglobin/transferrin/lactoferrin family receptor n=1 Tax=Gilliamella sp. G0441 TaxID=3384760 RepID=UPI003D347886
MSYKKVSILLLFMSFSSQAESVLEDKDTKQNIDEPNKPLTKNNMVNRDDIDDVITVIAGSSTQDELKKINSVIAGRSTLSSGLIEQKQSDNVAELLNTLPGVSAAGSVRPGGQTLNIWGFGKVEDVKIIVDGAQKGFQKYQQGSIFVEPELLKQVEVNKGPHDVKFGNGGFGGVIKMETKDAIDLLDPNQYLGALIKYSFHSNNHQNMVTSAVYGRTQDDMFDGLIYYTNRDSGNFKRPDGSRFEFSEDDMDSYMAKLNFRPNEEHTFTLSGIRSKRDSWQPWAAKYVEKMTSPTAAQIKKYGYKAAWLRKLVKRDQQDESAQFKWNYQPTYNPLINLTLHTTYSKTKQHDTRPNKYNPVASLGTMGNESWVSYTDKTIELENVSIFNTGAVDNALKIGLQAHLHDRDTLMYYKNYAKKPNYNNGYFQPAYMPSGKQQTYSFYIQDELSISDFVLSPSLRYDYVRNHGKKNYASAYNDPDPRYGHDYSPVTYSGWTPRFGSYWQTTQNVGFFGDISYAWQAPTIDESYEVQFTPKNGGSGKISATSRHLKKERNLSIRIGNILDFNNLILENDKLQVRSTLFRQRVTDEIFVTRGFNGSICGPGKACPLGQANYRNIPGKMIVKGFELETFYDSKYWFASATYSIQKGERDTAPQAPWMHHKTYVATIAPRTATLTTGFKIPDWNVRAGWNAQFVRKQDRTGLEDRNHDGIKDLGAYGLGRSSGYSIHNLFASWQPTFLPKAEIKLTIDNLFNKDYRLYLGENTYGLARNFKASVSYRF